MATPLRFLRRRRQPKGGAAAKTTFFQPAGHEAAQPGERTSFFAPAFVQTKLTVNQPGDAHEQEADKMAEQVVQRKTEPDEEKVQRKAEPDEEKVQKKEEKEDEKPVQRKTEPDEEKVQKKEEKEDEKPIQKKAVPSASGPASAVPVSARQLRGTKGQGSVLPTATLTEMSQAFGHDFTNVRIHTTSQAEQLSHELRAQAFTHGSDIYFNAGKYNPETTDGKRLLAHELTHVVQQDGSKSGAVQRYPVPGSLPCNEVVGWLNSNSPYAPEWAQTHCTYAFNGQLTIRYQTLPDGTVRATVSGSPRLSVAKSCPIDSPAWSPTARPDRAAEVAAWSAMKTQLTAHEREHQRIGEDHRLEAQTNFRAVQFAVTGSDQADALQQIQTRVNELQQQWNASAQADQDAIDPFRGANLACP
ncbi:eCIS core domain-containing protein [Spirosoma areae]